VGARLTGAVAREEESRGEDITTYLNRSANSDAGEGLRNPVDSRN
jgi:hypothetical protein